MNEAVVEFSYPVVMKLDEGDVIHKSDEGFVRLNITNQKELESAYNDIQAKYKTVSRAGEHARVLLMKQVDPGLEVIIGAKRDATFGPVVMFGLGGVLAEVFDRVAMRICPVDKRIAMEMIDEEKGAQLLSGYRGHPPLDKGAVADIILRVARLLEAFPKISELDLNPVIVHPKGALAVDARISVT